jgi:hypothetical protein
MSVKELEKQIRLSLGEQRESHRHAGPPPGMATKSQAKTCGGTSSHHSARSSKSRCMHCGADDVQREQRQFRSGRPSRLSVHFRS